MDKPTDEQVRKFWRWCGFRDRSGDVDYPEGSCPIVYPDSKVDIEYPDIDLNNLFFYAVPKLDHPNILLYEDKNVKEWYCKLEISSSPWEVGSFGQDPILALFWALWQMKE